MKKTLQLITLLALSISLFADEVKQEQSKSEMYREELKKLSDEYLVVYVSIFNDSSKIFKTQLYDLSSGQPLQDYMSHIQTLNIPTEEKSKLIEHKQRLLAAIELYNIVKPKVDSRCPSAYLTWFKSFLVSVSPEEQQKISECTFLEYELVRAMAITGWYGAQMRKELGLEMPKIEISH